MFFYRLRYAIAIGCTCVALFATRLSHPLMEHHAFDLFQGAVFLSAWFGGFGPGFLSAILSILSIDYFLLPPLYSLSMGETDVIRLVVFGVVALVTGSLSARLREAQAQLQATNEDLEQRLAERTAEVLTISSREQQRIGQDIHDGLSQILAGTRLLAGALQGKLAASGRVEAEDVEKIESRLDEAQAQADAISRGLYPIELESGGVALPAALAELADRMRRVYSIDCRFAGAHTVDVADGIANHLFRIAQEAVMNGIKNGRARRVDIRLFSFPPKIILAVADDGSGFPPEPRNGMGLKIMNYRAKTINAALRFRPRIKGGTLVACILQR